MSIPNIIAFCGPMGSGKDSYGSTYKNFINSKALIHYSFATPLKEELNQIVKLIQKNKLNSDEKLFKQAKKLNTSKKELQNLINILSEELESNPNLNFFTDRSINIRKALQYWGTTVRRTQDINYWVNKARIFLENKIFIGDLVYITDARFSNECNLIRDLGGVLVYLEAPEKERIKRIELRDGITPKKELLNHPSEIEIQSYPDFNIKINTVENNDLLQNIKKIIKR